MSLSQAREELLARLCEPPYQSYSYAYPHKSAYRPLQPARRLETVWASEPRDALFLYIHIPFCSYRCGFCNLFALATPNGDVVSQYLAQLQQQWRQVRAALGQHRFVRFALGGGTPSYLHHDELARLFSMLHEDGVAIADMPAGMEVSPETVDAVKMQLAADAGIQRISMGVQSFAASEVKRLVRPQQNAVVDAAIGAIRAADFPLLNLDLIYGIEGQSVASFLASIESALAYQPEEIYLYPLYVRPRTGLGRIHERCADTADRGDIRLEMYRAGRDLLRSAGYQQVSMRLFRAAHAPDPDAPAYSCQRDGMVGLGCGARSYTAHLHYSSEYAVARKGVHGILQHWLQRSAEDFAYADYGFELDEDERRRRHVLQSLLMFPGLDRADYRSRFGADCLEHLPMLGVLPELGLAQMDAHRIVLSDEGMAHADVIGPWLVSPAVRRLMDGFELR
ncbi:coproporphyrinogen III oxidase [Lysobacteraceae bacterium NML03-0222]|nr:coproporphyrinogen III oxidase [Xanthomonadaceae bacterium NML03-0222]